MAILELLDRGIVPGHQVLIHNKRTAAYLLDPLISQWIRTANSMRYVPNFHFLRDLKLDRGNFNNVGNLYIGGGRYLNSWDNPYDAGILIGSTGMYLKCKSAKNVCLFSYEGY